MNTKLLRRKLKTHYNVKRKIIESALSLSAIALAGVSIAGGNEQRTLNPYGEAPPSLVIEEVEFFKFTGHEDGQAMPDYTNLMVIAVEGEGITSAVVKAREGSNSHCRKTTKDGSGIILIPANQP